MMIGTNIGNSHKVVLVVVEWCSIPVKSNNLRRQRDKIFAPNCQQSTKILRSFCRIVETNFSSIDAQTRLFVPVVDAKIAVNAEHLFDVHVVDEPHLPHVFCLSGMFEVLVPCCWKGVWNVRMKSRCNWRFVAMEPILKDSDHQNRLIVLSSKKPARQIAGAYRKIRKSLRTFLMMLLCYCLKQRPNFSALLAGSKVAYVVISGFTA